jgi:predicted MPP superfamily phosphohydrolase
VSPPRGKHNHWHRRWTERLLDFVLGRGWAAALSFRCGLHGRFGETHYSVELPADTHLPRSLRIAFASDFHAGPTTHPKLFEQLQARLRELRPDVLLLGGDFVSFKAEYIAALIPALQRCEPPLGTYAVVGNHDLWVDDAYLRDALRAARVQTLVNDNRALPAPFSHVSICGMDDPWAGVPDARGTFGGAGEVRILLVHAPDGLLFLAQERFHLGFAGHTHAGQVALPDGTPIVLPEGPLCRRYPYGRFDVTGCGPFIVSRGIGCSTLPIRVNADPELVLVLLAAS